MESNTPKNNYDESQIQVLEGLEAVRRRPGMYIGSTDERGLHHLVYEIVDNAVDEALAGFCKNIIVTLHKDGSVSVQDDGRGFPVGIHPKLGRPAVEVCLTVLHAGGKFGGGGYKVSGGLHGVGASCVNALSHHLQVNVYQSGNIYQQEYSRGKILYDLKIVGETERTGTTIRFWPDVKTGEEPEPGIFETGTFDFDTLKTRFREMAFLNKGIRIILVDERGEIAAMRFGLPQLPVGWQTDVLCGCKKEKGIILCLRSMNPQWIAVDEITSDADVKAIAAACYCGVKLLATAHAGSVDELLLRPVYRSLLELKFFRTAYVLSADRTGTMVRLP